MMIRVRSRPDEDGGRAREWNILDTDADPSHYCWGVYDRGLAYGVGIREDQIAYAIENGRLIPGRDS
jgi:hypothetical protein